MSKQTFTTGQVLTAQEMTDLQKNDYNQTVSAKVASYTLVASDAGTRITMANVAATTITVNTNLFTAGDTLTITNISTGVSTITAGTATVSTAGSLALNQYDSGTLYFTSTGVSIWNGVNPGDITGVTAGTGISGGGTSGTVTVTNSMATAITTNGDLLYGTGSGTFSRLGIGTTGQNLVVASGIPSWATPAGGGKVLQVVQATTSTQALNSTTTFADTGLSATITPTLATSKVLILISHQGAGHDASNASDSVNFRILRGATDLGTFNAQFGYQNASEWFLAHWGTNYLDSPATTSATTYKTQFSSNVAASSSYVNKSNVGISTIILLEIGA